MFISESNRILTLNKWALKLLDSELSEVMKRRLNASSPTIPISCVEEALIRAYSGMVAYTLNDFLRGKVPEYIEYKASCLYNHSNFLRTIQKLPLYSSEKPLYRGTKIRKETLTRMQKNGFYTDFAFISTSTDKITPSGQGGAMWHLRADLNNYPEEDYDLVLLTILKHTSGRDISLYSADSDTDGTEILFMPNTKFSIKNTKINKQHARDILEIDVEEVSNIV
ncbi:hypothetical protein [Aureispira anguillae]|uniref:Uncharacterized protein n=1 Tax=Aureispira anguillae TaxID=2864201 RepID=A0A915YHE2_9BACT|nr:hypothetical protein [Aureispira anguillae]BDS12978.1 hypothetical protein AsAng_0037060 [Aureispira anguillae]